MGNNSCKIRSSMTKLKLDLYYVNTNSYTKFQVNISKDCREKSGKLKYDGQTDKRTDREAASKLRVPRQAGRGLIILICFPPLPIGGFSSVIKHSVFFFFAFDIAHIEYLGTVWFISVLFFQIVICPTCAPLTYTAELVHLKSISAAK